MEQLGVPTHTRPPGKSDNQRNGLGCPDARVQAPEQMRDFRGGNRFAEQESLDLHASISICFPSRLKAVARTGLSPKNGRAQRARGRGIDLGGARQDAGRDRANSHAHQTHDRFSMPTIRAPSSAPPPATEVAIKAASGKLIEPQSLPLVA
jgi:hypothetical protein